MNDTKVGNRIRLTLILLFHHSIFVLFAPLVVEQVILFIMGLRCRQVAGVPT